MKTETETKDQAKAGRPEIKNKNQDRPLNRTGLQQLIDDLGILEYFPPVENEHNKPEDITLTIAEPEFEADYFIRNFIRIKNPILNLAKYMNMDYEPEGSHE